MSILDSILGGLTGGGGQTQGGSPIASVLGGLLGGGNQGGQGYNQGGGGMGGALAGMLGGAGGGAGLQGLLGQFHNAGLGSIAQSWVGNGANQSISPDQVRSVFGDQQIQQMSQQSGMPQQDLLSQLAQHLPSVVDRMTPNGQMPGNEPSSVSV